MFDFIELLYTLKTGHIHNPVLSRRFIGLLYHYLQYRGDITELHARHVTEVGEAATVWIE